MNDESESNHKILIIDNDPKQNLLLESVLKGNGFRIVRKNSGEEAVKYIMENGPVSIIFSIFNMTRMNGLGFFKIVKRIFPASYRILSSCYHSSNNLPTNFSEGDIHHFLLKPFLFEEVVEQVKAGIRYHSEYSSNKKVISIAS